MQFAAMDMELFFGQISMIFLLLSDKHKVVEPFKVDFFKNLFLLLTFCGKRTRLLLSNSENFSRHEAPDMTILKIFIVLENMPN